MQLNREHDKNINVDGMTTPQVGGTGPAAVTHPSQAHAQATTRSMAGEAALSRLIVLVAMASGAFLRLWQINAVGFNTDEAVYAGQAAAIAGVPVLKDIFPIFRAHPLLFPFILSLVYRYSFSDVAGRLVAVAIGLATVYLTYEVGKKLYGRLPGAFAAAFMALMPYHVVVSRQVLLDGPMVFFTTLTLYMLARFGTTQRIGWLYAAAVTMGLSFLSKETAIILLGAIYTFLALAPELRVRLRDIILAPIFLALVIAPFPITLLVAGGTSTGRNYLVWQLFRRPNHDWFFYPGTVPLAIGVGVVALAAAGLLLLWRERSWRETLLLSWIVVPSIFFQIWPVKGYQYLLPIAPAVAVLAGRLLGRLASRIPNGRAALITRFRVSPLVSWVLAIVVVASLGLSSWQNIQPQASESFLAGTGGVAGGRETGFWIQHNVPGYAQFMTVGASMANIIEFYGERKAYGLATSPNPLHRNPSYEPILNPDYLIRSSELQYVVWDSFSSARSPFFAKKLMAYVTKYNGRAIHTESITFQDAQGNWVTKPIIIVYEVRP